MKSKLPNLLLRFDRWKIYLELLHIKKVDRSNEDLIKMLWKSVIYNEFVPPDGNLQNLPYIQRELRKRRKDTLNSDGFNYQLGNVTFQSPVWVNALKQMIEDMVHGLLTHYSYFLLFLLPTFYSYSILNKILNNCFR